MDEERQPRRVWLVSASYRDATSFARSEDGLALFCSRRVDRLRVAVQPRQLYQLRGREVHLVVVRPELLTRELDERLLRLQDQGATLEHRSQW